MLRVEILSIIESYFFLFLADHRRGVHHRPSVATTVATTTVATSGLPTTVARYCTFLLQPARSLSIVRAMDPNRSTGIRSSNSSSSSSLPTLPSVLLALTKDTYYEQILDDGKRTLPYRDPCIYTLITITNNY